MTGEKLERKIYSEESYFGIKPNLSENSMKVLERRYLQKNSEGKVLESPAGLFYRVAENISQADLNLTSLAMIHDYVESAFYYGFKNPLDLGLDHIVELQKAEAWYHYNVLFGNRKATKLVNTNLFSTVRDWFNASINVKTKVKFAMYVAHELNLAAILKAFNYTGKMEIPPFASLITFTLTEDKGEYYVQAGYNFDWASERMNFTEFNQTLYARTFKVFTRETRVSISLNKLPALLLLNLDIMLTNIYLRLNRAVLTRSLLISRYPLIDDIFSAHTCLFSYRYP